MILWDIFTLFLHQEEEVIYVTREGIWDLEVFAETDFTKITFIYIYSTIYFIAPSLVRVLQQNIQNYEGIY